MLVSPTEAGAGYMTPLKINNLKRMKKSIISVMVIFSGLFCLTVMHYYSSAAVPFKSDDSRTDGTVKAAIIATGDEILIGQITDTNSSWIADKFNLHGIEIYQITAVHDDPVQIIDALRKAEEQVDLVILTG
ncbi:MAG: molybdopterin-binding protein [Prolixibacteraceae bacterium]|nr:molybdopterin-binding protein [Prolixibacteraceae bacterium]